jgi:hypothetical protein
MLIGILMSCTAVVAISSMSVLVSGECAVIKMLGSRNGILLEQK